ncbi:Gfo/Idh/MocA family oxidoreductase [Aquibacillus koreensis]|uniref:Gfo/Idh/MocA family oxidoreductase n=1 Tax=Aquibacillus koreensis TaxID=279446 RepID=A0A9X4AIW7_9BACI|nr:Gfo/Idh/MocA family oxidoreductase [Aquibacillus koreensis]MCT2537234.1 Gfo/Idh/MocA family oxidoreductase [Aquibacillus koreensis]MDC3421582.1 Gfo/Idh/MocA family oxidoreductase [Aquibacillus koreensis]
MKQVKWGILSTADIGRQQVIPAIQRSNNGEVVAVASRGEKARQFAQELNIPKAYTNYEELLNDPDIDAVYIPLPNSLHKHWVIEATKQGKHVLCEKPAALDFEELNDMIDAANSHGVNFMEAFMYQYHPQHEKVKEVIASGAIGDVTLLQASFSFLLNDGNNIRLNPDLGGGALYDVGCYTIHSLCYILDQQPNHLFASAKIHPEFKVDTTVAGTLSFDNGVQANFDCSFDSTFRQKYQVVGSEGIIEVFGPYRPDVTETGSGLVRVTKSNGEVEEFNIEADQYKLQVEDFADAIIENRQPKYNSEKMINNMKVLDAVFKSIESGNRITL